MLYVLLSALLFPWSFSSDWTWSVYAEAGFKILTPVALSHEVSEVPTPAGLIRYHQFTGGSVSDPGAGLAFVIDHYNLEISDEFEDAAFLQDFFQQTLDQMVESLSGSLLYSDVTVDKDQAKCTWKAAYLDDKGVVKGTLILRGDYYYGLQVFGLLQNKPEVLMNKFLDSFTYTGIPRL